MLLMLFHTCACTGIMLRTGTHEQQCLFHRPFRIPFLITAYFHCVFRWTHIEYMLLQYNNYSLECKHSLSKFDSRHYYYYYYFYYSFCSNFTATFGFRGDVIVISNGSAYFWISDHTLFNVHFDLLEEVRLDLLCW